MSLLRTIYSLAKYEHFKKYYDGEEIPLLTTFLSVWNSLVLSEKACNLVLAADRLIGYLLCYGGEIAIGQRYFQPTFYRPQKIAVYFKWDDRNKGAFCAGCQREECGRSRFSSWCPRFRIAWAIEHVTDCTNKLVSFVERGQRNVLPD